jgi:hypothetical protein
MNWEDGGHVWWWLINDIKYILKVLQIWLTSNTNKFIFVPSVLLAYCVVIAFVTL